MRWMFPFLYWRAEVGRASLQADIIAGAMSAALILPQAIAFAAIAGMPLEYGIYTSIIPVIIAALWSSSRQTLCGPNAAVCLLIGASVAPIAAAGTEQYIAYVLILTLLVGIIQIAVGTFGLSATLDFISQTVVSAIVMAVGIIIIVSSAGLLLGVPMSLSGSFFSKINKILNDLPNANIYAVSVGSATLICGLIVRRLWRRYALVCALSAGAAAAAGIILWSGSAEIKMLGRISLSALPLSLPRFDMASLGTLRELIASAFSIAFLGLLQTVVIARSLSAKSGQHLSTRQEVIAQGLSNLAAPFFSSFASSASINRSAAHYEAGAKTPLAAVFASLLLGAFMFAAAPLVAYLPMPVVGGMLALVGLWLISPAELRQALRDRQEAAIFVLTFVASLGFGLNAGIFAGLLSSLLLYLWRASTPNVAVEEYFARDGRSVQSVTIDGNLFFGSMRHVERCLAAIASQEAGKGILLLRTEHLTYIDIPGAMMLAAEVRRRRSIGDEVYIYLTRNSIRRALENSGLLEAMGEGRLIHRDHDHPMKSVLWPFRQSAEPVAIKPAREKGRSNAKRLAERVKATRLLQPLSFEQTAILLQGREAQRARTGEIVVHSEKPLRDHLILLEGALKVRHTWLLPNGSERIHVRTVTADNAEAGCGVISPSMQGLQVQAVADSSFLLLDSERIDEMFGMNQQFAHLLQDDPRLKAHMRFVKQANVFRRIPLNKVKDAFKRMKAQIVSSGDTILRQGETGDCYYLIESGSAEVVRIDPFTGVSVRLAVLGPGDAFGEEALLQDGCRNATVRMLASGQMLTLGKADFDELVRPTMAAAIEPEAAYKLLKQGQARLIDCRYDMEYEESRIPGAQLMPLDHLRENISGLAPNAAYIVYCRSGRRSLAAAFLLRERNIEAMSLSGGLRKWPYDIDFRPLSSAKGARVKTV